MKRAATASMRGDVIWAIRDARGLNASEKAFLFTVESRGEMFTSTEVSMADTGLGRTAFYKLRNRLRDRGLLLVAERENRTTRYRVSRDGILRLVPQPASGRAIEPIDWDAEEAAASSAFVDRVRVPNGDVRETSPEEQRQEDRKADAQENLETDAQDDVEGIQQDDSQAQRGELRLHSESIGESDIDRRIDAHALEVRRLRHLDEDLRRTIDVLLRRHVDNGLVRIGQALSSGGWEVPLDGQEDRTLSWLDLAGLVNNFQLLAFGHHVHQPRDGYYHFSVSFDDKYEVNLVGDIDEVRALMFLSADFRHFVEHLVALLRAEREARSEDA